MTDKDDSTQRKYPHEYEGKRGFAHVQSGLIQAELREEYVTSTLVGFSSLEDGYVTLNQTYENEKTDLGILSYLTPDEAREIAASLLDAAEHVETENPDSTDSDDSTLGRLFG